MTIHEGKLWCSNSGRITCAEHGGGYFTSHLATSSKIRRITTPLDVWELVSEADKEWWRQEMGKPMSCEECGAGDPKLMAHFKELGHHNHYACK